jgi:hypothetical protein
MVLDHVEYVQLLNDNPLILSSIGLGHFEMEIPPLSRDFEMGLCRPSSRFPPSLALFLATGKHALFASQGGLTLAIIAWVLNQVALAIGEKGLEPHVKADVRMITGTWRMLCLYFSLTDNKDVPVSICTQDQMRGLGRSLQRTVQLDLQGAPQLLGKIDMLAIRGQLEVYLVLAQLKRMPSVRLLEPRKATFLTTCFAGEIACEGFGKTICQHLHGRGGDMFTTMATEGCGQIILRRKSTFLLMLHLDGLQHLIVEMTGDHQGLHECMLLLGIWIEPVLKRSHVVYCNVLQ